MSGDLVAVLGLLCVGAGVRIWMGAAMTDSRRQARRHLRAVATALVTGDTSGYRFVPTLPRKPGSTDTYGSTHRGDL